MAETRRQAMAAFVVEEHFTFTLADLCRACDAQMQQVQALVEEGVLDPTGGARPDEWQFSGQALRTTRVALRLSREWNLQPAGVALVIGLLDEIGTLRSRLRRHGDD